MIFPRLEIKFGGKHKKRDPEVIDAADFIAEKSYKAKGKRLTVLEVASITELKPLRFKEDMPGESGYDTDSGIRTGNYRKLIRRPSRK